MLSSTSRNIHTSEDAGRLFGGCRPSVAGCRPSVGRVLGEHRQTYWLLTESRTAPAHMPSELRPTPVSVLTGAGRLVQRALPELRPKCDRVDFKNKIRSTPGRMWNSATFGRFTNSAGDRWICDVGITNVANFGFANFLTNVGENQGFPLSLATFSDFYRRLATTIFARMFAKVFAKDSWRLLATVNKCLRQFFAKISNYLPIMFMNVWELLPTPGKVPGESMDPNPINLANQKEL